MPFNSQGQDDDTTYRQLNDAEVDTVNGGATAVVAALEDKFYDLRRQPTETAKF